MKSFFTYRKSSEPSKHHIDMLASDLELKNPGWLANNIAGYYCDFWVTTTQHQSLYQKIVTLPLVESPGKSYMANSSCYRCQHVDKRIYLVIWLKNYLFLPIQKAAVMITSRYYWLTYKNSTNHFRLRLIPPTLRKFFLMLNLFPWLSKPDFDK